MAASFRGRCRWRAACLAGLALAGGALLPAPARAQAAAENIHWRNYRTFRIPFDKNNPDFARVRQLRLHVSRDMGKTWGYAASANPADGSFPFSAPDDGWYWFAVQLEDIDGRLSPADASQFVASLKVCVDTVRPVVALRPATPREGTVAVEWDIEDKNLDPASLRIEYRPLGSRSDQEWLPLSVQAVAKGEQGWKPPLDIPLEVRLYVRDRAGNETVAVTSVSPGGKAAGGPGSSGAGNVLYVKNRNVQLHYKLDNVGDSGVQGIDVWVTRDAQRWERQYQIDAKKAGIVPGQTDQVLSLQLADGGRWGISILPRSGVGLSEPPPQRGDQPHVWIEVDETRPVVQVNNVVVGQQGADLGRVIVYYTVSDKFLRPKPVTISYSDTASGPWTVLEKDLESTGSYVLDTRSVKMPYQFYLKVEAVDEAGNVGSAVTAQPVKIDFKIPRATTIKVVTPTTEGGTPPGGTPPPP
jgi:hypothetical protein